MRDKEIIKEYVNDDLTIVWKPRQCIHAKICINTLPKVYNVDQIPWINIDNATTEELKDQIAKCPSGALSYYTNDENTKTAETMETKIEVRENGPLLVHGELNVTLKDGKVETRSKTTAFCRCGASTNKPYCDGSHNKDGFKG